MQDNLFLGPNIKKLKGEFEDLYRFRVGKYRLFYEVHAEDVLIFIVDIKD
ncbi:type II toxin-antitoxin system RelE/ParE family toxin, partial [Candidatus Margulisiibacteriota bacterium]